MNVQYTLHTESMLARWWLSGLHSKRHLRLNTGQDPSNVKFTCCPYACTDFLEDL